MKKVKKEPFKAVAHLIISDRWMGQAPVYFTFSDYIGDFFGSAHVREIMGETPTFINVTFSTRPMPCSEIISAKLVYDSSIYDYRALINWHKEGGDHDCCFKNYDNSFPGLSYVLREIIHYENDPTDIYVLFEKSTKEEWNKHYNMDERIQWEFEEKTRQYKQKELPL